MQSSSFPTSFFCLCVRHSQRLLLLLCQHSSFIEILDLRTAIRSTTKRSKRNTHTQLSAQFFSYASRCFSQALPSSPGFTIPAASRQAWYASRLSQNLLRSCRAGGFGSELELEVLENGQYQTMAERVTQPRVERVHSAAVIGASRFLAPISKV